MIPAPGILDSVLHVRVSVTAEYSYTAHVGALLCRARAHVHAPPLFKGGFPLALLFSARRLAAPVQLGRAAADRGPKGLA